MMVDFVHDFVIRCNRGLLLRENHPGTSFDEKHQCFDYLLAQPSPRREVTLAFLATVPATGAKQKLHPFDAELVELVDGAQHGEALA